MDATARFDTQIVGTLCVVIVKHRGTVSRRLYTTTAANEGVTGAGMEDEDFIIVANQEEGGGCGCFILILGLILLVVAVGWWMR